MGVIAAAAGILVGLVSSAVAAVASVVAVVAVAVANALAAVLGVLWSSTVGFVVGALEGLGVVSMWTSLNVMGSLGAINTVGMTVYTTTFAYIGAITAGFKAFLEAIHFATLVKIHKIAYLVSEDYRLMVTKVYQQFAGFSAAIGRSAEYMTLAMVNARNVVLDASTMLGRGYDLAQIGWLNDMNSFLTTIKDRGNRYQGNPELLLVDIDTELIKPATNLKGKTVQGIFTAIDATLDVTSTLVNDFKQFEAHLKKIVHDLPDFIRKEIEPWLNDVTEDIDRFIYEVYDPTISKVSQMVDIIGVRIDKTKEGIEDIIDKLKRPGDLLLDMAGLPEDQRRDQEEKIFDAANRPILRSGEVLGDIAEEEHKRLQKIIGVLERPIELLPYEAPEVLAPVKKSIGKISPERTWFVGDF